MKKRIMGIFILVITLPIMTFAVDNTTTLPKENNVNSNTINTNSKEMQKGNTDSSSKKDSTDSKESKNSSKLEEPVQNEFSNKPSSSEVGQDEAMLDIGQIQNSTSNAKPNTEVAADKKDTTGGKSKSNSNKTTAQDVPTFLGVSSNEVTSGEEVELVLDLAKISFENYEIKITNPDNLAKERIDSVKTNAKVKSTSDGLVISVSKSNNLDKIKLVYTVSKEAKIGDIITFEATATNLDEVEEGAVSEYSNKAQFKVVERKQIEQSQEGTMQKGSIPSIKDNFANTSNNKQSLQMQNNEMEKFESKQNNVVMSKTVSTTSMFSSGMTQEANVYLGESNNYLNDIQIEGYTLNPGFSKTQTTYFINVDSSVESLNIECVLDDENASYTVYGNDSLTSGTNKILINVTAENGSVKTYRIYATK